MVCFKGDKYYEAMKLPGSYPEMAADGYLYSEGFGHYNRTTDGISYLDTFRTTTRQWNQPSDGSLSLYYSHGFLYHYSRRLQPRDSTNYILPQFSVMPRPVWW